MRKAAGGIQFGVKVPDPPGSAPHKVIIGPAQKDQLELATQLVCEKITGYRMECLAMLNAPGAKKNERDTLQVQRSRAVQERRLVSILARESR